MAFATKYRIEFDTIKNRQVKIDIEEDGFGGSVTNLTAAANPLEIDYPNGEFDKLASIRESKVRIRILSDVVSAEDFLTTSDTQYKVKIYVNGTVEWVGWLDNDYLSEPFLDTPEQIELSATDGLSLLKGIQLKDGVGAQIWGLYQVKTYIVTALFQTGLDLDFWSFINMYPASVSQRGTNADFDAFYYSWIMSHTFLEGPRDFNDCYTVLSKICEAFNCTLFQARGAWYFVHTNDRIAGDLDGTKRDYTGSALSTALNQNFAINIGLQETVKLINADAVISWEKAYKDAVIRYRFNQPPIYFRNWDLIDGTLSIPLSGLNRSVFTLDNWGTVDSVVASFYSLTNGGYIGVEFDAVTGAELTRYILFYRNNNPSPDKAVTTTRYPISKNDRVRLSYSRREKNASFSKTIHIAYVKLITDTDYYYLKLDGNWEKNVLTPAVAYGLASSFDRRNWIDVFAQSKGVPENGFIEITLMNDSSQTNANEIHYKDLSFSIETFFNQMTTVDGYEYKCEQTETLKNKYDNQIYISNSPNVSTQGAIMTSSYGQVADWKYYSALDVTAVNFAKYIDRATWRTLYRNFIRLEGALFDLYGGSRLLSPLNTIQFTAIPNTEFMLTTLRMDVANERAEFTAIELRKTNNTNDFDELGDESFRYLNVRSESVEKIYEDKKPLDYITGIFGNFIQKITKRKLTNRNSSLR
jgi:hypothetical protein